MPLSPPTSSELRTVAADLGFSLTGADLDAFRGLLADTVAAYDIVDQLPDEPPPLRYPRTPGCEPREEDNPHNAWYFRTTIEGAPHGPLAGKRVAIKDNVCVAGVPMMAGASTLEGYVPDVDATIVTRILDAGGTILGKAHCEYFCLSGSSHTSARGPVHNPWKRGYSGRWFVVRKRCARRERRSRHGRSAAIRAARSGFRRRCAGWWDSSPPTGSCPIPV